ETQGRHAERATAGKAEQAQQSARADVAGASRDLGRVESRTRQAADSANGAAGAQGSAIGQGSTQLEATRPVVLNGDTAADGSGSLRKGPAATPVAASGTTTRGTPGERAPHESAPRSTAPEHTPVAHGSGTSPGGDKSPGAPAPKPAETRVSGDASASASANA